MQRIRSWIHSPASVCALLVFGAFVIILGLYLCVCTPRKYDLRIGSISHVTVVAPKDVEDVVATNARKEEAANKVIPTYVFQQDVKQEVLSSLADILQELRTIQRYGNTLRPVEDGKPLPARPFSESEIDYAYSLVDQLVLQRNQITTLLRIDQDAFDEMVDLLTVAVDNEMNSKVTEGKEQDSIKNINNVIGYKVDISLMQNIIPSVLNACIKPNDVIDQEATDKARQEAMNGVDPVYFEQGENIIREGDKITVNQIEMLRNLGMLNDHHYDYSVYGGALILTLLAMIILLMMLRLLMKDVLTDLRKLSVILIIMIISPLVLEFSTGGIKNIIFLHFCNL